MIRLFEQLDLRSAAATIGALESGTAANRTAPCRTGSIDHVRARPGDHLVATGDLHDNPLHLARLVKAAGLGGDDPAAAKSHLTLHEVIHGGRLVNDMDFSFRALVRVAALKGAHPEHVHVLLANHELSQIVGAGIVKDGLNVVQAFNEAVQYAYADEAPGVLAAIAAFIRSMPLALRCTPPDSRPGVLAAHSLPAPELMDRFDPGVLERDLAEDDYQPRRGSAHLMVWGRGHTPDQLRALADRWRVSLFVLGHEKADSGSLFIEPNTVVLNSDHEHGVMLPIDLRSLPIAADAIQLCRPLRELDAE